MTPVREEFALRLKKARESCGLTQEEVAAKLGVQRATVSQIESALRQVSGIELGKFAHLYARDLRDFMAPSFTEQDPLAALSRARAGVVERPETADDLRQNVALGRELANLEKLLGLAVTGDRIPSYRLPPPQAKLDAVQQGEEVAEQERHRLGLSDAPVGDWVELLLKAGVRTAVVPLPTDTSGMVIRDERAGWIVVVNGSHHGVRQRFSLAHEYAHAACDADRNLSVGRESDRRALIEVRANAFAAALLLPERGVRAFVDWLGKGRDSRLHLEVYDGESAEPVDGRTEPQSQDLQLFDVLRLAHAFGASRPSVLYRLRNFRLLTEKAFDDLLGQISGSKATKLAKSAGLNNEAGPDPSLAFKRYFFGLALDAYRRDLVSTRKLHEVARLAEIAPAELDEAPSAAD